MFIQTVEDTTSKNKELNRLKITPKGCVWLVSDNVNRDYKAHREQVDAWFDRSIGKSSKEALKELREILSLN